MLHNLKVIYKVLGPPIKPSKVWKDLTILCRRGIKKALLVTEKKEEKEQEVDLLFAEDEDEEDDGFVKEECKEKFTPMCTPTKNRKNLLGLQVTHYHNSSIFNPYFSL